MSPERRVLLLVPTTTYKATDFIEASRALGVQVVVGSNRRQALESAAPGGTVTLDFSRPDASIETIRAFSAERPLNAIIGADDETTVLAARAAEALELPHNPVSAVEAARDKYETRRLLSEAGRRVPWFRRVALSDGAEAALDGVEFPCVLKPLFLSASRGVLRADNASEFVAAFERIARILGEKELRERKGDSAHLLIEAYMPGDEVALEGLLEVGRLRTLALFDKPDPLEGPTFEETIFVTPSALPVSVQDAVRDEVERACEALGLREGPVHAELRVHEGQPWILEVAARTIGGLCSRTLKFGAGIGLEELVLRHALGMPTSQLRRESTASGVMMMPVPHGGILRDYSGLDEARAVPGIVEVTMTLHRGAELVPLPEGHQYLGFLFARADSAAAVESALREAHARIAFEVEAPRVSSVAAGGPPDPPGVPLSRTRVR